MPRNEVLALLVLLPAILFGQAQYGSIGGRVADATGAVIPGVAVNAIRAESGQVTAVKTDSGGRYLIPQLLPGIYNVVAEQPGFKQVTVTGITLDINQNVVQDLVLEVGEVTSTVSVTGSAMLVETVSGSLGHVVENKEILELPLNGRQVFDLVNLVPGGFRTGGAGTVSLAGGRTQTAAALLDGITNGRGGLGAQNIETNPPIDIMQEFRVEANSYSAQYGRSNGGIINATTKSGTNSFHGVLYEFLRNDKLDSRNWNADEKAPLRRNQFGGSLGGPIRRNRTFFFYNFDAFRESRGVVRTRTVPLAAWKAGDFSGLQRQVSPTAGQPLLIYDPATGQREPFPGNRIPLSRFDPVAAKTLAMVPLPNRQPDNPITQDGNWQQNTVDPTIRNHHTVRIDNSFNDRTQVFGRMLLIKPDKGDTGFAESFGAVDPNGSLSRTTTTQLVLSLNRVLSPSAFLSVRTGMLRNLMFARGLGYGQDWPSQLGLQGVAPDVFPRFNMSNGLVPTTNLGTSGNQSRVAAFTTSEVHADLNVIRGSHTLKFGGSYVRFNANDLNRKSASGTFTFQTRYTRGLQASGAAIANTGMSLADFMLGRPVSADVEIGAGIGKRSQYYAGYFQDDWRINSRLTLNLGVRYELETPFYEVAGRISNFDPYTPHPLAGKGDIPANAVGVVTFPNRNGKDNYLVNWDCNNFSPRIGFAWRPPGSADTVVRGGFGMFFGNQYNTNVVQKARLGFSGLASYRDPVPFTLSQGLPAGAIEFPAESELTPAFGARGTRWAQSVVEFLDPQRRTQYNFNYNLTVERQWKQILFQGAYVASLGRKVVFPGMNVNDIPTELLAQTDIPERLRRPYTQYDSNQAQIQLISPTWGFSNYHAFTFKSEKRFSNGIGWMLAYSWSKWIDNVTFGGSGNQSLGDNDGIQNIYDLKNERSLSTDDVPHRLVVSPIIEMPFGKGKRWLNSGGITNAVLGGWELSTIATFQSGSPFGVTIVNGPRDLLGDAANGKTLRPNIVGNMDLPANQKGQPAANQRGIQWFNAAAFAAPARYTYGNAARTLMMGPGWINFDTAVSKSWRFQERYQLQFRWEAFNSFNTPHFGSPNSDMGSASFGLAAAPDSVREMQFALKLYF